MGTLSDPALGKAQDGVAIGMNKRMANHYWVHALPLNRN